MKVIAAAVILFLISGLMVPLQVHAQTISASQTITITARVAPARSIIVDANGQIIKIYSNTNLPVQPKVYLFDVPGVEVPLTAALQQQYNQIVSDRSDLEGKIIVVKQPSVDQPKGVQTLFKPLSLLRLPTFLIK